SANSATLARPGCRGGTDLPAPRVISFRPGRVYRRETPPARNRVSGAVPGRALDANGEPMAGTRRDDDGAPAHVPRLRADEAAPLVVAEVGQRARPRRAGIPDDGRVRARLGDLHAPARDRVPHRAGGARLVVHAVGFALEDEGTGAVALPDEAIGLV